MGRCEAGSKSKRLKPTCTYRVDSESESDGLTSKIHDVPGFKRSSVRMVKERRRKTTEQWLGPDVPLIPDAWHSLSIAQREHQLGRIHLIPSPRPFFSAAYSFGRPFPHWKKVEEMLRTVT
jgi:hypothetical protein